MKGPREPLERKNNVDDETASMAFPRWYKMKKAKLGIVKEIDEAWLLWLQPDDIMSLCAAEGTASDRVQEERHI